MKRSIAFTGCQPLWRLSMASPSTKAQTATQPAGFTKVPNAMLKADLSMGARLLYNILLSYCYQKDYCFPSYATLMGDLHCHSQALRKYIKELIDNNHIRVIRPGQG